MMGREKVEEIKGNFSKLLSTSHKEGALSIAKIWQFQQVSAIITNFGRIHKTYLFVFVISSLMNVFKRWLLSSLLRNEF